MSPRRKPLNVAYAGYMGNHPFGTALYTPLPLSEFHPGSCGYFDANGSWNPITDISDSHRLTVQGYAPLQEKIQRAPAQTNIQWGPLTSENVNSRKVNFSGGVSPALATALPVNLSAELAFSNSKSGGALLITTPPIVHERLYHESMFTNWVVQNAERLVKDRSEIFDYGLCVVTKTWATENCAIHIWDEASKEVKVGFDAGVDVIGQVGPGVGWSVNNKDGGWMKYKASENDNGLVVFFDGLRFTRRKIHLHRQILKPITRTYETVRLEKTALQVSEPKRLGAQGQGPGEATTENPDSEQTVQDPDSEMTVQDSGPEDTVQGPDLEEATEQEPDSVESTVMIIECEPMRFPGQPEAEEEWQASKGEEVEKNGSA